MARDTAPCPGIARPWHRALRVRTKLHSRCVASGAWLCLWPRSWSRSISDWEATLSWCSPSHLHSNSHSHSLPMYARCWHDIKKSPWSAYRNDEWTEAERNQEKDAPLMNLTKTNG
jgi:hypothetical protein